jgi:site-specific recombinase XerD
MTNDLEIAQRLPPRETTTELSDTARRYALASLRPNTRRAYATQLALWLEWKSATDLSPADPADVANYVSERAAAGQSVATLRTIVAAIKSGHEAKGWSFDSTASVITKVMRGIANSSRRLPKQAEPLPAEILIDVLTGIADGDPALIDLRDAALLAVGYIFALRRSELVALDFNEQGDGEDAGAGMLRLTPKTIEVAFAQSKTTNGKPEVVAVPREENIEAARAIEVWVEAAEIKSGEPLFRAVKKGGKLDKRLTDQSVALIVKSRMAKHAISQAGLTKHVATVDADRYSGHSLRVGFCVTAAEHGADVRSIATVTRHKSLSMPARYAQRADQLKTSPHRLAGVGLKRNEEQTQ